MQIQHRASAGESWVRPKCFHQGIQGAEFRSKTFVSKLSGGFLEEFWTAREVREWLPKAPRTYWNGQQLSTQTEKNVFINLAQFSLKIVFRDWATQKNNRFGNRFRNRLKMAKSGHSSAFRARLPILNGSFKIWPRFELFEPLKLQINLGCSSLVATEIKGEIAKLSNWPYLKSLKWRRVYEGWTSWVASGQLLSGTFDFIMA